jgi:TldD protein
MAHKQGFGRFEWVRVCRQPRSRAVAAMPNVSLQANSKDVTLDDLIGGVDNGSISSATRAGRLTCSAITFSSPGRSFFRIRHGKLAGQLKDVAYQSRTPDFWNALDGSAARPRMCSAGPSIAARDSLDRLRPLPTDAGALFRQINVLNTAEEGH